MKPEELHYLETHEWVHLAERDGRPVATVGISAFAVEQLTDLVFLELPKTGTAVAAGQEFAEVESVKAVSPIYSPVAGEVIEVNAGLPDKLDLLSQDPYGAGWIARIAVEGSPPEDLLTWEQYRSLIAEEA